MEVWRGGAGSFAIVLECEYRKGWSRMMTFLKLKKLSVDEFFGLLGFGVVVGVGVYLILKKLSIFHSPGTEDTLLAVVVGQVFYNGYMYRAVQEIKEVRQDVKEIRQEVGEMRRDLRNIGVGL